MDLKFSEMSVDTTLAQKYLKENEVLLELYNDYNGTIEKNTLDGDDFFALFPSHYNEVTQDPALFKDLASKLKQNATLIAQLEYHIRNIPIEETYAQLNLLIQYFRTRNPIQIVSGYLCRPEHPLLVLEYDIAKARRHLCVNSKALVAICHLLVTLHCEAGLSVFVKLYKETEDYLEERKFFENFDSGTVAVVSDDADVDSAVDKFISVSKQAPWRLRRILVQETVYQEFKEALTWKCKLNKSGSKAPNPNVVCSDTLTYNDRTFLIDPVALVKVQPSVVTVEAFRTTKEMISLVQQYNAHYLSLWINGVAEINEVTHSTTAPVVWVNTIADFRGPPQVSHAVFSISQSVPILPMKCAEVAKLCELSQSWLKLDFESRRDVLCAALDEYILLDPENKIYTNIKHSISSCTQKSSFVDVGKDYVCIGMVQPEGIKAIHKGDFFSEKCFESILQGNALMVIDESSPDYSALELKGVPVVNIKNFDPYIDWNVSFLESSYFMRTRVIWTNSGTIFAN